MTTSKFKFATTLELTETQKLVAMLEMSLERCDNTINDCIGIINKSLSEKQAVAHIETKVLEAYAYLQDAWPAINKLLYLKDANNEYIY